MRKVAMAWNLSGKMLENCTCNMFCPCWFGVKELMIMDKGYCGGLILFRIQDGISNSINLAGRDVVLFLTGQVILCLMGTLQIACI
jgi:hypothetical protein